MKFKQIFTMDVEKEISAAVDFSVLLTKNCLKGEFYVTGNLVEKYPHICRKIAKNHIMGGHGYNHENFAKLSYIKAEKIIKKTVDIFKKNNIKIEGWRFPGFSFKNNQLKILIKYKLYDSSLNENTLRRWGCFIFIRNFLSTLKRGAFFIPTPFPKKLNEKPWSVVDLNDSQFYRKQGILVTHCYNYKNFKSELEALLK